MPLLGALPVVTRIDCHCRRRLASDRSRVKQQFRAHERHGASALGKPLIPADAHTDARVFRVPDLEAGVSRAEVIFFLVSGAIRNVRLAIDAEVSSIRIDDGDRIEVRVVRLLEEADGQHHVQLACDFREMTDGAIVGNAGGDAQVARVLFDAEIGCFEQLLDEDDLRALFCGLTHELFGIGDVRRHIPATGELRCRHHHFTAGSVQMRWSAHANTLPGLRMPLGSSAFLSNRMVEISAAVRDKGR